MPNKGINDALIFKQSFILKSLSATDRQTLYENSERVELLKQLDTQHNIIFDKGDAGDCMYILIDGAVNMTGFDSHGNQMTLAHFNQAGDYFGEQALFDSLTNRTARAIVASEACVLRIIRQQEFDDIVLANQPGLYDRLNQQGNHLLQKDSLVFSHFLYQHVNHPVKEEKFIPGTSIYKEGKKGERFYLILDGEAKVWRNGNHIATLIEGNYFGDAAILKKQAHEVTIKAGERLTVVSICAADFYRLHEQSDTVKDYIKSMNGFNRNDHGIVYSQHQSHYKNQNSVSTILTSKNGEACSITRVVGKSHLIKFEKQVNVVDEDGKILVKKDVELRQQDLLDAVDDNSQRPLLYIQNNRLVGAEIATKYAHLDQIVPAIIGRKYIWPWQRALFRLKGDLWIRSFHDDLSDKAIICSCIGTTRGELKEQVAFGCDTAKQLAFETGASLTCGFCKSRVAEIASSSADLKPAVMVSVSESEKYCNDSKDIQCFRFIPENGMIEDYLPGQHIRLETEIDGLSIERPYTLTSDANQKNYYEIAVKQEEKGVFSNWLHQQLTAESSVRISRPQGHFHIRPSTQDPIVCFVNGVGVTPAIAFMRFLCSVNKPSVLYVDYSVSTVKDMAFVDEFKSVAVKDFAGKLRITRDQQHISQLEEQLDSRISVADMRVSEQDVKDLSMQYPNADFYICGSKAYDESLKLYLRKGGIEAAKIHSELFDNSLKSPKKLMLGSVLTLFLALLFFIMPAYSVPDSIFSFDPVALFSADYSGYSILALGSIGLLVALPRRWDWVRKINAESYRLLHIWLGVLALIVLFFHTGFSMGGELSTVLTLCFLSLFIMGSVAGITIALQEKLSVDQANIFKKRSKWIHILVSWPLPVLLLTHILSTYTNLWF